MSSRFRRIDEGEPPARPAGTGDDGRDRLRRELERSNEVLQAQNAALRRLLMIRDRFQAHREVVLTTSQAFVVSDDAARVCARLVDAAVRISGADGAATRGPDGRAGPRDAVRGAVPGSLPAPAVPSDDLAWSDVRDGVLVAPLGPGAPQGHLWLTGVPRPLAPGVADDLLNLASQAGAALARIEALAAARRQAAIAEGILTAVPDGIVLVDDDGRRLLENPRHRTLRTTLGPCTRAEAADGTGPVDASGDLLHDLGRLDGDPGATAMHRYCVDDGARAFTRYSAPVVTGDGERVGRVFVHRETTAEREAERARDRFLALVSHELRTPLTSVLGYLDLLEAGDAGPLGEDQGRAVGVAHKNARRLRRMVDDLLDVAHAHAGGMGLAARDDDLAACVVERVASALPAAHARGIALHGPSGAPVDARIDSQRIGQVVDNLVGNAIAYCRPGDSVTVDIAADAEHAVITVADTGPGVSPDDRDRVFAYFQRGGASGGTQGAGIGLALSRAIVLAHGGDLRIDPTTARGATFRVTLPRHGTPAAHVPVGAPPGA